MNATISRFLIGAAVLGVGVALLLDALNIIHATSALAQWWPLAIVLVGVVILINDVKNYLWALVFIIAGVATQLQVLGYSDIDPWKIFWPLLLIVVGVSIVFRRPAMSSRSASKSTSNDITAILGGTEQKNTSDNFTASRITAILGGAKLDIRKTTIKKSATVDVTVLMGGIELIVPRNVTIKNQTNTILGGIEDKTDQDSTKNAPTLVLTGTIALGGIEIKN